MITRRQAREESLQILFAHEINKNSLDDILNDPSIIHEDEQPFSEFTIELVKSVEKSSNECDKLTEARAKNWSFDRIAIIDRLIFRLAITEFLHFPDIPPKVTIDEAVELAKKYSTGNSGRFVNGILDNILMDLKKQRRIYKEGRGMDDHNNNRRGRGKK